MRFEVVSGKVDTLFSIKRQENQGYGFSLQPPAMYLNSNNDSILIFKNVGTINNIIRCSFSALNIRTRKMEWKIDSLDQDGTVYPPIVEGNRIYVQGLTNLFCIDANNGQIIWKRFCNWRFMGGTNLILYKDRLAAATLDGRFVVVDKKTGEFIYNYPNTVNDLGTPEFSVEHNGVMYIPSGATGFLYAMDLETGNLLGKWKSPNRCQFSSAIIGYSPVAVNKDLGLLYVSDGHYLMCAKTVR